MTMNVLTQNTSAGTAFAYDAYAMSLRADFAENLSRIRKSRGLTQHDLADRTGMSVGAVRAYEQKVNWPEPERMELLCKALQTTPGELLRTGTMRSKEIPLEQVVAMQQQVFKLIEILGIAGLLPERSEKKHRSSK